MPRSGRVECRIRENFGQAVSVQRIEVPGRQIAGPMGPDVLTLQSQEAEPGPGSGPETGGGLAVATTPPRVRMVDEAEINEYASKRRSLVIRNASGDRIVALIELVSPGNKSTRSAPESFVNKAAPSQRLSPPRGRP